MALIPLVQHFISINGPTDVNQTAFRVIALQPFAEDYWAKFDTKVPYDWENDRWPASVEVQLGKNINSSGLSFSKDGSVLAFGVQAPAEDDAKILPEDKVTLDLWHWNDGSIQPQQARRRGGRSAFPRGSRHGRLREVANATPCCTACRRPARSSRPRGRA